MRYEIKFILNSIEFDKFKTWLLINTGFVKKYEPRLVNSIYFDDLNNSSANDNLAGIGKLITFSSVKNSGFIILRLGIYLSLFYFVFYLP